jgi:hypothetical protein
LNLSKDSGYEKMTNIDNNTNMTHSLYVGGKDRTAEVLKRKEMAEKELMMK